ncbi:hypothetical protein DASC09_043750 [Saccharomycopsis crataegensis]|uniref:Uncharacterized protein n=1 Tax=Saccharomycopsis crataegensis TaxID=43959 RepID=A0AAV5QR79_9ASCO|nr:hypothetical protein DASC09_043750 [Saccharomycopsis crataegensis]
MSNKVGSSSDHPAESLKHINAEIVAQLSKLPSKLPTEGEPYLSQIKPLRSSFEYAFVYNWLSVFRGAIKMSADPFHVYIWEEELAGVTFPSTFINRLKVNLINSLLKAGMKIRAPEEFDQSLMSFLGDQLDEILNKYDVHVSDYIDEEQGAEDYEEEIEENNDEDEEEEEEEEYDEYDEYGYPVEKLPKVKETPSKPLIRFFDLLPLGAKVEIFYILIDKVCVTNSFAKYLEKFEKPIELRLDPIFTHVSQSKFPVIESSYYLLDDNRLYLQKLIYSKTVHIPTSGKKLEVFDPLEVLDDIDPSLEWECLTNNFYEMYDLIIEYRKKPQLKKLGQLLFGMLDEFAGQELKWKKNYQHRLKEKQMQSLLMNRKRSSRLQEKEERKRLEEVEKQAEYERRLKEAAAMRAAKRIKLKEQKEQERQERLNKRIETPAPMNEEVKPEVIEIDEEPSISTSLNDAAIKEEPAVEVLAPQDVSTQSVETKTAADAPNPQLDDVSVSTPAIMSAVAPQPTDIMPIKSDATESSSQTAPVSASIPSVEASNVIAEDEDVEMKDV